MPDPTTAKAADPTEVARVEALARFFHEWYEALAPAYGYKTRDESAVPWDDVPGRNKALMCAVASQVLHHPDSPVVAAALNRSDTEQAAIYEAALRETIADDVYAPTLSGEGQFRANAIARARRALDEVARLRAGEGGTDA